MLRKWFGGRRFQLAADMQKCRPGSNCQRRKRGVMPAKACLVMNLKAQSALELLEFFQQK